MNERLNSAFKAVTSDGAVLSMFRRDPAAAMRQFNLSACELDSLKSGDERLLLAHGLSPELVVDERRAPHWFGGLFATISKRVAVPAVVAVLLVLAIQNAGPAPARASRGVPDRVGVRLSRMSLEGPSGLRRASGRVGERANVRAARAMVRDRGARFRGLSSAIAQVGGQVGCEECSPSTPPG